MQLTTDGLVLREVKIGEADRIITLLTRDMGVISASAKRSLRLKNKLATATGLLCYADYTLYKGKTMYVVDEAQVKNVFFELRGTIEGLALAMYMAELVATLAPEEAPAGEYLDFLLLSFNRLCQGKTAPRLMKAAFELRLMAMSGYMPNLVACDNCGIFEEKAFYFDIEEGYLLCADCAQQNGKQPTVTAAALAAMRHILFSEPAKLYSFTLREASLQNLSTVCGAFSAYHLDKPLKTKDFLLQVLE